MTAPRILKWDGDIVFTPPESHPMQVEVYEEITGILLGLFTSIRPDLLQMTTIRIPLIGTAHYGVQFANEDKFPGICHAEFVDMRIEDFFFNRGNSRKRVIWTTHRDWMRVVADRQKAAA